MGIPIAYDCKLKRPGCVLIQAAMGGSVEAAKRFDPKDWLTAPTPDMHLMMLPEEKLDQLVAITEAECAKQEPSKT